MAKEVDDFLDEGAAKIKSFSDLAKETYQRKKEKRKREKRKEKGNQEKN